MKKAEHSIRPTTVCKLAMSSAASWLEAAVLAVLVALPASRMLPEAMLEKVDLELLVAAVVPVADMAPVAVVLLVLAEAMDELGAEVEAEKLNYFRIS